MESECYKNMLEGSSSPTLSPDMYHTPRPGGTTGRSCTGCACFSDLTSGQGRSTFTSHSAVRGKGTSLQAAPWRLRRLSSDSEPGVRARPDTAPPARAPASGGAPQGVHGGAVSDRPGLQPARLASVMSAQEEQGRQCVWVCGAEESLHAGRGQGARDSE